MNGLDSKNVIINLSRNKEMKKKCSDGDFKKPAKTENDGNLSHLAVGSFFHGLWMK